MIPNIRLQHNIKLLMQLLLPLCLLSLLLLTTVEAEDLSTSQVQNQTASTPPKPSQFPNLTLDQQINEQQLQQIEQTYNEQQTIQLSSWLSKQLNDSRSAPEMAMSESFVVHLQTDQSYEFRWDLNIPNSMKRDYHLQLNVLTYQDGADISIAREPQEESFITAQIRQDMLDGYRELGKLYVTRTFRVHFPKEAQVLRFTSYNPYPVLLEINMEAELRQVEVVRETMALDKQFEEAGQKMSSMMGLAKQTEKTRGQMYKWEWGFLEREERYEDEMLRLTAVELFAILVTAIAQMYCIKGLLDSKQIV